MKKILALALLAALTSACGHKASLKTPTQAAIDEQKKIRQEEKDAKKAESRARRAAERDAREGAVPGDGK